MKKIIALLLALTLIFTLAACANENNVPDNSANDAANVNNDSAEDGNAADAAGDEEKVPGDRNGDGVFTIGFTMGTETNEFFKVLKESMVSACEENNIRLLSDITDSDQVKMRTLWDTFEMQGADIIIDVSMNSEAGSMMAPEIMERLPLITVDAPYEGAYFFGVNNQIAGEVAGQAIDKIVQEKWGGQVDCMLQVYIEHPALTPRNAGVSDILLETTTLEEDDIYWVTVGPGATLSGGEVQVKSFVQDYLTAHPDDHHIVISCNNDNSARGALAAAEAAGRMDDILITGHNADGFAVEILKGEENAWVCTVSYNSSKYGEQLVDLALRICNGEDVPMENYAEVTAVTRENVYELFPE